MGDDKDAAIKALEALSKAYADHARMFLRLLRETTAEDPSLNLAVSDFGMDRLLALYLYARMHGAAATQEMATTWAIGMAAVGFCITEIQTAPAELESAKRRLQQMPGLPAQALVDLQVKRLDRAKRLAKLIGLPQGEAK